MSVPMDPSSMPSISRALFSLLVNDIRSERERERRERNEKGEIELGAGEFAAAVHPRAAPLAAAPVPHRHLWSGLGKSKAIKRFFVSCCRRSLPKLVGMTEFVREYVHAW